MQDDSAFPPSSALLVDNSVKSDDDEDDFDDNNGGNNNKDNLAKEINDGSGAPTALGEPQKVWVRTQENQRNMHL